METALGRQHAGEGDTCLACVLTDRGVSLGSLGQEVMEERPGMSIEFVASLDILVSGHFAFLSGNPPAYAGQKTPQGGAHTCLFNADYRSTGQWAPSVLRVAWNVITGLNAWCPSKQAVKGGFNR